VNVYAESSAVLAWLLAESSQRATLDCLQGAKHVFTSSLTGVECARALARARALKRISAVEELAGLRMLDEALASWHIHEMGDEVIARARISFPIEPVRTLDALHLATVDALRAAGLDVTFLSLDSRVRENAIALGFTVTPASQ
jgi:predicted LPLAT superfamily acyltransferase